MTTRIFTAARAGAVALAAGLVAAVAGLGFGALPAAAHVSLISSTPEDGATLDEAPTEVMLEFDGEILPEFTQVAVLDADDNNHEQGEPEIDGGTVTQTVGPLDPGEYRVSYRVGSSDGHPVSGVVAFTVAEGQGASEQDEQEANAPTDTSTEQEAGAPDDASESSAEEEASTPAAETAEAGEGGAMPLGIVGAAAAIVAGAVAVFLIRRRGASENSGP